jgi:hypothetical protein
MDRIEGEWFRCAYCSKDLCHHCEELDTHDPTHLFYVLKSNVDMQPFKHMVDFENPVNSRPVVPFQVYK